MVAMACTGPGRGANEGQGHRHGQAWGSHADPLYVWTPSSSGYTWGGVCMYVGEPCRSPVCMETLIVSPCPAKHALPCLWSRHTTPVAPHHSPFPSLHSPYPSLPSPSPSLPSPPCDSPHGRHLAERRDEARGASSTLRACTTGMGPAQGAGTEGLQGGCRGAVEGALARDCNGGAAHGDTSGVGELGGRLTLWDGDRGDERGLEWEKSLG